MKDYCIINYKRDFCVSVVLLSIGIRSLYFMSKKNTVFVGLTAIILYLFHILINVYILYYVLIILSAGTLVVYN